MSRGIDILVKVGVLVKAVEGDPDAIQYFVNKGINGLSTDDSVQNMMEIYLYYMNLIEVNDLRNVNKWLQHSLRINDNGFSFMNTYRRTAAGECKKPFTDIIFKMSDSELIDAALAFMLRFTFTTGASSESISRVCISWEIRLGLKVQIQSQNRCIVQKAQTVQFYRTCF